MENGSRKLFGYEAVCQRGCLSLMSLIQRQCWEAANLTQEFCGLSKDATQKPVRVVGCDKIQMYIISTLDEADCD